MADTLKTLCVLQGPVVMNMPYRAVDMAKMKIEVSCRGGQARARAFPLARPGLVGLSAPLMPGLASRFAPLANWRKQTARLLRKLFEQFARHQRARRATCRSGGAMCFSSRGRDAGSGRRPRESRACSPILFNRAYEREKKPRRRRCACLVEGG